MFVALMVVKNEENILPFTIGHLLYGIRVDRLIIADNGSTDSTRTILAEAANIDDRVRWSDASGPWNPQETITGLAEDARRWGAKWLMPTDADEFHWLKAPLRDLDVEGVGAWELGVVNFVQLNRVRHETSLSLRTMYFRARAIGGIQDARALVMDKTIAFIQSRYTPKIIVRSTSGLTINRGNHSANNIQGRIQSTSSAEILHAPMRSRDSVYRRTENARALPHDNPEESWHLKRLLEIEGEEQVNTEWHENSIRWGRVGTNAARAFAIPDLRLRSIALRQAAFAKAVTKTGFASPGCVPQQQRPIDYDGCGLC